MRKYKIDKKYFKIAIYTFAVLAACIILYKFLDNIGAVFGEIGVFVSRIASLLRAFIVGFFIAFFFTPLVNFLDSFIGAYNSKLRAHPTRLRVLSIVLTYALFLGCLIWLIIYMIPTIANSFNALFVALPQNIDTIVEKAPEIFKWLDEDTMQKTMLSFAEFSEFVKVKLQELPEIIRNLLVSEEDMSAIIDGTVSVVVKVASFFIGIIISFYMLISKELVAAGAKKICLAMFKGKNGEKFIQNMQRVNVIFQNFVLGKLVEAVILTLVCLMGLAALRVPYAVAISVVIGVTNMFPYVGPFIGTVPMFLIVLIADPIKAVWMLVYILVVQAIDNYIIVPKLLGESTGLEPLQVLFAIMLGAYFGGLFGMFLAIPILASFKLFASEAINRRYREKYPHGVGDLKNQDEDEDLWVKDQFDDIPED